MSAYNIKVNRKNVQQSINRNLVAGILLIACILTLTCSSTGKSNNPIETALCTRTDGFVTDLAMKWNKTYGGTESDIGMSLVKTADGGYALAGRTNSFGAGSDDFWLVRTVGVTFIIVPDDYSTIQEAVNNAIEGDVIFVRSGVYYEHVVVNKTVSLVGEDVNMTIVDGSGTGNVFAIDKDGVNITGFTVQNSGGILGNAGIRLDNVSLCSISGNRIRDNFAGIWFEEASENLITANEITANVDDGIVFNYSHNNTISENQIALHEYFGIVINWSCNNTICCNNVTQTYGPSHGDGINLWRSSGNSIFQNRVEDNARYGIRIETQSNNNTLSDNTIRNCTTGLQVYDYSNYNCVHENNVAQCSVGIDVSEYSNYNAICQNNINMHVLGFHILESSQNTIYSNNFVDNTVQAYVESGAANLWDNGYPSGGNYWSDYDGTDVDGDRIGDTPYVIGVYNVDRYPLINPWSRLLGDINDDGTVDVFDAVILANAFGSIAGSENWMAEADLNGDGIIDIFDAIILANNFGRTI